MRSTVMPLALAVVLLCTVSSVTALSGPDNVFKRCFPERVFDMDAVTFTGATNIWISNSTVRHSQTEQKLKGQVIVKVVPGDSLAGNGCRYVLSVRTGGCMSRQMVDGKQKGDAVPCGSLPPYWKALRELTADQFPTYVQQHNGVIVPSSIRYDASLSADAKQALSNLISQLDFDLDIIGSGPIDRKRKVFNADAMNVEGQDKAQYTVIEHGHQKQVQIEGSHLHLLDFHRGYFSGDLCTKGKIKPSNKACNDPTADCAQCEYRNGDRRLIVPSDLHRDAGKRMPKAQPGDTPPVSPGRRQNYALFLIDCTAHDLPENEDMLMSLRDHHENAMSDWDSYADDLLAREGVRTWKDRTDCDSIHDHGVIGSLAADYLEFPDMGGEDSAVMIRAVSYTRLSVPGTSDKFESKMTDLIEANRQFVTASDASILAIKKGQKAQDKKRQQRDAREDATGGGNVYEDDSDGSRDSLDLSDILTEEESELDLEGDGMGGDGVESLPPVTPQPKWAKEVVKRKEGMFTLALKKPFIKRFGGSKGGGEIFVMPRISIMAAQTRIRSMGYQNLNSVGTLFGGYLRIKAFFFGKEWTVFENVALILALYLKGPKKWQVRPMIFGPNPPGKPLMDLFKLFTKGKKDKGAETKAAPPAPPAQVKPDPNSLCHITKDPFFALFNLQVAGRQYNSASRTFNQKDKNAKPKPKIKILSPKFRFMIGPVPVAVGIDLGISIYAGMMADTCAAQNNQRMGAAYAGAQLEVVGTIATPSLAAGIGAQVYVKLLDVSLTAGGEMSGDFKSKCMAVTPVLQGPSGTVGLYLQLGTFRRQWIVAAWYGKRIPGRNLFGTCPLGSGNTVENTEDPDLGSYTIRSPCVKDDKFTLTGVSKFPGTFVYRAKGATPLWYRLEDDNTWSWSPYEPKSVVSNDGRGGWMPVTNNVVCYGDFKGRSPHQTNLEVIDELVRVQQGLNRCDPVQRTSQGVVLGTRGPRCRASPLLLSTKCGLVKFDEFDTEASTGKYHVSWYKRGKSTWFRKNPSSSAWEWTIYKPTGMADDTWFPVSLTHATSGKHRGEHPPEGAQTIIRRLRCAQ